MLRTSFTVDTVAPRTLVASFRCVTPEYFPMAGLRVLSGRDSETTTGMVRAGVRASIPSEYNADLGVMRTVIEDAR